MLLCPLLVVHLGLDRSRALGAVQPPDQGATGATGDTVHHQSLLTCLQGYITLTASSRLGSRKVHQHKHHRRTPACSQCNTIQPQCRRQADANATLFHLNLGDSEFLVGSFSWDAPESWKVGRIYTTLNSEWLHTVSTVKAIAYTVY